MKARYVVALLALAVGGCKGKKSAAPIGDMAPVIAEVKGADGKSVVRITTKVRAGVSVSVVLDREGPLRHTDSCFVKEGADSCIVEMPVDKFSRPPAEIAAGPKPFPFIIEAKADGVPSIKKELTWARPPSCWPLGNSLTCEGLEAPGGEVRADKGLVLSFRPATETMTMTAVGTSVTASAGKEGIIPLDGKLITKELLSKVMANTTSPVQLELPAKITNASGTVFEGPVPVSLRYALYTFSQLMDKPIPWAADNNKMLVFNKRGKPGGGIQGTASFAVGDPNSLLDVGRVGFVEERPGVSVPCGAYAKVGAVRGDTKNLVGRLEVVEVSVRQLRTGKELRRKTLTATGNPCRDSATLRAGSNSAGYVSLPASTVRAFFEQGN
jgi:hypothetical protein